MVGNMTPEWDEVPLEWGWSGYCRRLWDKDIFQCKTPNPYLELNPV